MQLISNPAENGNEPKCRIDDKSSSVLAYVLHRREIEILRQTPQIHEKNKNPQGMQIINDPYKARMTVSQSLESMTNHPVCSPISMDRRLK